MFIMPDNAGGFSAECGGFVCKFKKSGCGEKICCEEWGNCAGEGAGGLRPPIVRGSGFTHFEQDINVDRVSIFWKVAACCEL